jgi:hypothetical protein
MGHSRWEEVPCATYLTYPVLTDVHSQSILHTCFLSLNPPTLWTPTHRREPYTRQ